MSRKGNVPKQRVNCFPPRRFEKMWTKQESLVKIDGSSTALSRAEMHKHLENKGICRTWSELGHGAGLDGLPRVAWAKQLI